jgi:glucoamylase
MKRRVALIALLVVAALAITIPSAALASGAGGSAPSVAPGAPGSESYFDLARKDCVGTARNTSSKVWFTVADGVLSDVYWPTIDATNVHTLQYLVSDGHSFTDLQQRDMSYRLIPDPTGMSCTVVASDAAHGYTITTTYIADPGSDSVLMRVHFSGPAGDQLYARLDPLAGGTGGGGPQNAGGNSATLAGGPGSAVPVAFNTNTTTDAVNRSYAVPTFEALESADGFSAASVGYAGSASDGLTMLDASHRLTTYSSAPDGHVALTAAVRLPRDRTTTLALGFGTTEHGALATAGASVHQPFARVLNRYESGWVRYDAGLRRPSSQLGQSAIREYYASVNVVKASEDKTFAGAIAAGLASPWGQSVPAGNETDDEPTYFGSYREVFARDLYEAFTGLLVAGDIGTARDATLFLFDRQQQADGSMPRNSLTNGKPAPDTGGLQLDETSYPILMAWQSGLAGNHSLYENHVIPAADFLVAHGPSDGVERWEEQLGDSPSTIAAEIAGLTAAAHIAAVNGDPLRARLYQAVADEFARTVKGLTVTDNGPFITPSVPSYFIRIDQNGNPDSSGNVGGVNLGNGSLNDVDQRSVIDAGFLELVRLGVLSPNDPTVKSSLTVVDDILERSTPSGVGFYRYGINATESVDGYGDCFQPSGSNCTTPGAPWPPTNTGTGHLWPVLSGERGEYELAAADPSSARSLLQSMQNMQSGQGLEPEQAWEDPNLAASPFGTDPATASIGFTDGAAAGSASPLTWAQAAYARLAIDLSAGRNLETPQIVTDRYVTHGMPGSLPVTITSPTPGASVTTATVTVSGTTTPGATVDAAAVGSAGGAAATATTTADSSGDWSLPVATSFGNTVITVTATQGASTGYAQDNVNFFVLPGAQVFSVPDPVGDDHGPGTFQYPSASDFSPGAFDLTGVSVNQTSADVYLTVSIKNLASTFGKPFGAQLLDIYVHDPSATATSTAAAFPTRNYTIAPADAWSERLELQGFGSPVWVNPSGSSLGAAQMIEDQPAGTVTLVLPTSAFGTVGAGWVFTVGLTGQNGFSADQARGFTQPAGADTFGVCPVGDTAAICSVNPSTMPEAIDTITPIAVSQATELDPTLGPVVLSGVGPSDP